MLAGNVSDVRDGGVSPAHSAKSLLRRVFPADRPALIRAFRKGFQGARIELEAPDSGLLPHSATCMLAELEADRFPLNLEEMDLCEAANAAIAEFRQTDAGADRVVVFKAG